ncbi:uncharacterized protein LOC123319821 [Coccinella septempunctata]|uniref:uncharacterized protein LOC123319821 n=1 Tax=Coccinella septempunctata TaxID=41139 RepID=UPI001D08D3ED|nr:uncharacterized protein LOC123319821 [Coccinella septempunctata]XP_044762708.1 uncharacterized protein LOC123319821 [Coccinella septempunctata]XP_044762709.1 uncharacterized protein LOC123319821 [Coccinella septempunctata]XP_044762710.1 uncharacterized protein LOC123319821 [Coccinella septempunctata]XP_044762711.1 uncharacterized protein LOC123319821 [Coccinella septempunctata]XP_044762712.1 uncharacterized protein LOC123319821 [Coccinella septempunctata]XP_044762713.1 uncharacterized prot
MCRTRVTKDRTTRPRLSDVPTTPASNKTVCDLSLTKDCSIITQLLTRCTALSFYYAFLTMFTCLSYATRRRRRRDALAALCLLAAWCGRAHAYGDSDQLAVENVNLDDIGAVFNKVAYGSTTKRSIPDTAYPVTTLATPLLTTYRYTDGYEEWRRVDTKKDAAKMGGGVFDPDFGEPEGYGVDLEKDHALPTSAPAADILKNNHNRHYGNPNRYNNDRLKPDYNARNNPQDEVTESYYKTTTSYNVQRNVRPTKSMYSKEIPRYVPPQRDRDLFTPPLPPKFQSPFQDKPTLRGTNNDFVHRRPIPPPSLMPNKDRIPFRPDLPKVNAERVPEKPNLEQPKPHHPNPAASNNENKKKTLNTPSQTVRVSDGFNAGRNVNESNFEYDKGYLPAITRILSGPNGRNEDLPDSLLQSVPSTPNFQRSEPKTTKTRAPIVQPTVRIQEAEKTTEKMHKPPSKPSQELDKEPPQDRSESVTVQKNQLPKQQPEKRPIQNDLTTQISDVINLRNVKEKERNLTFVTSDEVWLICWNVHIFLVLIGYIVLAIYSIYKLIRYENDPHMFSKSYFLTVHLMLTVICVLRIFYLAYDPYNVNNSFNVLLYDFLHNFPMSLMATTFAILILFLLKRTLTHLEVKTRPVFLVVFAALHIFLCLGLSILETFGFMEKASLIVCKPVFVLLAWALGVSYLYLYRIIKNVLAKKSQNLSEMCTQNISYASHITIAVALLFVLLGFVQLYALFFIEEDRFNGEIKHHWILWGFELSVRFIEISIITLLAIVVSLKMSQREKQTAGGFPLFPCTTSDSSTDNIYPNNCNTNPNAMNYSRNEMILDNLPTEAIERPILVKNTFQNDSFDKKSTLERYHSDNERSSNFDRFERPKWGSDRFDSRQNADQVNINNFLQPPGSFERGPQNSSARGSARKTYDSAKYYTKPKYDLDYNNDDYQHDLFGNAQDRNIYSEPIDNGANLNHHQYERTRHEFERSDFDRRSRNSSNTSGRRSTGRSRKNHARPHLGVQTLPNHQVPDSMLVDEQGFVRFRHMQEEHEKPKKSKKFNDMNQYGEA